MTTKVTITNEPDSNGDVHIHGVNTCEGSVVATLFPGMTRSLWITDYSSLVIFEKWPSQKPKPKESST